MSNDSFPVVMAMDVPLCHFLGLTEAVFPRCEYVVPKRWTETLKYCSNGVAAFFSTAYSQPLKVRYTRGYTVAACIL